MADSDLDHPDAPTHDAPTHGAHSQRTHDSPDGRGRRADDPTDIPPQGWKDIAYRLKDQARDDHVTLTAAGVAFFWFVALIPLLIAGLSLYGLVADPTTVVSAIEEFATGAPDEVVDLLTAQLTNVASSSSTGLGIGLVAGVAVALWSASSGMSNLVEAINIAYDEDDGRPFWRKRLLGLAFTVGFLLFAAAIIAVLRLAPDGSGTAGVALTGMSWLVVGLLMVAAISLLYRFAPNREEAQWRWVTWGAVIALVLWMAASVGFSFYVRFFGTYNETYGTLGAIVVTLLWLFITAIALIMGAEINAEIEHQTALDSTTGQPEPMGLRGAEKADTVGEPAE